MKPLGCQPVESTSLSKFPVSDVNLHPYIEGQRRHQNTAAERLRRDAASAEKARGKAAAALEKKTRSADQIRATARELDANLADLRAEEGAALDAQLTPAERRELTELNPRLDAAGAARREVRRCRLAPPSG